MRRKDIVTASGELDRLAASVDCLSERTMILQAIDSTAEELTATRIDGPLLFGRLWERLGAAEVLGALLCERGLEFAVQRAVFVSTLHRLFVSGSDRSCETWTAD